MEKLTFAFSSESIRNSFYQRNDEKNILQLPFMFKKWENLKCIVNNIDEKNIINFNFDIKINIKDIHIFFERPLPEIFNCDEIIIKCYDGSFSIKKLRDFIEKKANTFFININKIDSKKTDELNIEFKNYGSKRFNAVFNEKSIIDFFESKTSLNYLKQKKNIKFKYFHKNFNVNQRNIEKEQKKYKNFIQKKIEEDEFQVKINIWNNLKQEENLKSLTLVSNQVKIDSNENQLLIDLKKNLFKSFISNVPQFDRYISFEIILSSNNLDLDEKFNIVNNDKFDQIIKYLNQKFNENSFIENDSIIKFSEELSLKVQVEKLNLRKKKLRESQKIYLDNNLLFRVPNNEQETVLLFIKLATLQATPLSYINVLEYSTSEGIDAIADIQLDDSSPIEKDSLVEFEPTFGQFIAHRHPPKHVDYIICWKIENHLKKSLRKNKEWLYSFSLENYPKEVKVIEISKFIKIDVR